MKPITHLVERLSAPPSAWHQQHAQPAEANADAHQRAFAACDPMHHIEHTRIAANTAPLRLPIRIATWNLERCYHPQASAETVADCDVLLLSELDAGMARTQQRHNTALIAAQLDLHAAYGVEFLELGLGSPLELPRCTDNHNELGFHGNAVLARTPLHQLQLWRLSDDGEHWYRADSPEWRVGGRFALGARLHTAEGELFVVSVHLEYFHSPQRKADTFAALLQTIDAWCGASPLVIGGDLNTFRASDDWGEEPLFALAQQAGLRIHGAAPGAATTRASDISPHARHWRLDWMLTRQVNTGACGVRAAVAGDTVLSDHDAVVLDITALS